MKLMARWGWWLGLASSLLAVLVFSLLIGNWLGNLHQLKVRGQAEIGQWVGAEGDPLQVRVDRVEATFELPNRIGNAESNLAPNGMIYVRVLLMVKAKQVDGELPWCKIELRNAMDEQIVQDVAGIVGPRSTMCRYVTPDPDAPVAEQIEFQSQVVFLAAPAAVQDFDVLIFPDYYSYWRVNLG